MCIFCQRGNHNHCIGAIYSLTFKEMRGCTCAPEHEAVNDGTVRN